MTKHNYFDEQEDRCSSLLKEFNSQTGWFQGLTGNPRCSHIDFIATDKKGRLVHIEQKERKGTIEQFQRWGDVLIEPSKIAAFAAIEESGWTGSKKTSEQELYINYVDDGVIVFDINNIAAMNFYPNHRQRNFGKRKVEYEHRHGLRMEDAIIFKRQEDGTLKLVKDNRPQKQIIDDNEIFNEEMIRVFFNKEFSLDELGGFKKKELTDGGIEIDSHLLLYPVDGKDNVWLGLYNSGDEVFVTGTLLHMAVIVEGLKFMTDEFLEPYIDESLHADEDIEMDDELFERSMRLAKATYKNWLRL